MGSEVMVRTGPELAPATAPNDGTTAETSTISPPVPISSCAHRSRGVTEMSCGGVEIMSVDHWIREAHIVNIEENVDARKQAGEPPLDHRHLVLP